MLPLILNYLLAVRTTSNCKKIISKINAKIVCTVYILEVFDQF